jgi:alpha-glucosidase (family GH31 glycosyl hydrolase)
MCALCFESEDPRIWDFPYQYFLGGDLLVAPVVEPGAETWPLFVPDGDWIDAWTGDEVVGPVVVERRVPLDEIPVYIAARAAGALAPLFHKVKEEP